MKNLIYQHQSICPLWGRVKLNLKNRYGKPNVYSKNSSHYQVFSSNCKKLSLWCKIKLLPTHMDFYSPYIVSYMILWGNYNFPRSTNKIKFFDEISTCRKKIYLMKDLKYEHQSIFLLWGRVKLNFRDRYRKPNIYSGTSSHYQVFSSNSQKLSLW